MGSRRGAKIRKEEKLEVVMSMPKEGEAGRVVGGEAGRAGLD